MPPVLVVSGSPAFPYAAVQAIALAVFVVLVVILLVVRKCMVVSRVIPLILHENALCISAGLTGILHMYTHAHTSYTETWCADFM